MSKTSSSIQNSLHLALKVLRYVIEKSVCIIQLTENQNFGKVYHLLALQRHQDPLRLCDTIDWYLFCTVKKSLTYVHSYQKHKY